MCGGKKDVVNNVLYFIFKTVLQEYTGNLVVYAHAK